MKEKLTSNNKIKPMQKKKIKKTKLRISKTFGLTNLRYQAKTIKQKKTIFQKKEKIKKQNY